MSRFLTRRTLVVALTAGILLVGTSLVSAAWLASGTGSGTAKAGTS